MVKMLHIDILYMQGIEKYVFIQREMVKISLRLVYLNI